MRDGQECLSDKRGAEGDDALTLDGCRGDVGAAWLCET